MFTPPCQPGHRQALQTLHPQLPSCCWHLCSARPWFLFRKTPTLPCQNLPRQLGNPPRPVADKSRRQWGDTGDSHVPGGIGVRRGVPAMLDARHASSPSLEMCPCAEHSAARRAGGWRGRGAGAHGRATAFAGSPGLGDAAAQWGGSGVPASPPMLGTAGQHFSPGLNVGVGALMRQKGSN